MGLGGQKSRTAQVRPSLCPLVAKDDSARPGPGETGIIVDGKSLLLPDPHATKSQNRATSPAHRRIDAQTNDGIVTVASSWVARGGSDDGLADERARPPVITVLVLAPGQGAFRHLSPEA